jgi:hypothetical protein
MPQLTIWASFASSKGTGDAEWSTPSNATGAPNGSVTTVALDADQLSSGLVLDYPATPIGGVITNIEVLLRASISDPSALDVMSISGGFGSLAIGFPPIEPTATLTTYAQTAIGIRSEAKDAIEAGLTGGLIVAQSGSVPATFSVDAVGIRVSYINGGSGGSGPLAGPVIKGLPLGIVLP